MADDLVSAKQKLLVGDADNNIPPFNFDSLPMSVLDPLWNQIGTTYNLNLAELCVLKNARCSAAAQQEQFHWVGFFGNSSPPSFTALWHWISSIFITKKDHLPNQSVKESSSLLLGSS